MKLRARHVISGLLLAAAGPLAAVDFAAERDERFMQACMSDATVAAGQRQGSAAACATNSPTAAARASA